MLTRIVVSALSLLIVAAGGVTTAKAQDTSTPQKEERRLDTGPFVLEWTEPLSDEDVALARATVEKHHANVARFLGLDDPPRITVVLSGPAEQPNGQWKSPHVDWLGRVLLFRYTPDTANYFNALAHEMVHAFRFGRRAEADWFFEEGLSEFVALRVDPSLGGFPWFDTPVDVVVGSWLSTGEGVPLANLQADHRGLNMRCRAQSYSLRSAFFVWLGDTFGDDKVLAAAAREHAGALEDYETYFGASFETLEKQWHEAALARFEAIEDGAAQAKRFRTQSPIQYQNVCKPGEDF